MASVKSILNCIGVGTGGSVSILRDLFGFLRARVPTDPDPTVIAQVSLLNDLVSLKGKHIHLNIIRVGIDNFTAAEVDKIDYAIFKARNIYRTVSLGIGRVQHFDVTAADANGRDDIGSASESEDLTHEWTVPNNGLDVFLVSNISASFIGRSPVGGPCDKDDKDMNGVFGGEVNRGADGLARTFAHELGHYLGLSHNHGDDDCPSTTAGTANLMAQTRCASNVRTSVVLTGSQGTNVRDHCFVQDGC